MQNAEVTIDKVPAASQGFQLGQSVKVLIYPKLLGEAQVGQRIRFDCSPLAARLGTGGYGIATALLGELPPDLLPAHHGHLVKARYTPSQLMVSAAEEQDSPYHQQMRAAEELEGIPVVGLDLHSQLPAVLCGIRQVLPVAQVAYLYLDTAALPAYFSHNIARLQAAGWLGPVISCGQSFGGDIEAINSFSGLLAAKHLTSAQIVIAAQGPGNAGTDTPYGFSGLSLGHLFTEVSIGRGTPIAALRISAAESRERHWGISHHSLQVLRRFTPLPLEVVLPQFSGSDPELSHLQTPKFRRRLQTQIAQIPPHHQVVPVETTGLFKALRNCPVKLSTMGRDLYQDAGLFLGAAAAGKYAALKVKGASSLGNI